MLSTEVLNSVFERELYFYVLFSLFFKAGIETNLVKLFVLNNMGRSMQQFLFGCYAIISETTFSVLHVLRFKFQVTEL